MKTIRRDKVRRLAEAGKLVMLQSYHFDDMNGQEIGKRELPVRVLKNYDDFKEGFCNLWPSDFRTGSGAAWVNDNGTISLIVHGNCNYDFRVQEGA